MGKRDREIARSPRRPSRTAQTLSREGSVCSLGRGPRNAHVCESTPEVDAKRKSASPRLRSLYLPECSHRASSEGRPETRPSVDVITRGGRRRTRARARDAPPPRRRARGPTPLRGLADIISTNIMMVLLVMINILLLLLLLLLLIIIIITTLLLLLAVEAYRAAALRNPIRAPQAGQGRLRWARRPAATTYIYIYI